MIIPEKYTLGFKIDGHDIPDPSEFKYTTASVDVSAERNTSGLLVREMVATKHNVSLTWNALNWSTIQTILGYVQPQSFEFKFPNPETGTIYTGTYYVGDRETDAIMLAGLQENWYGSLSFDLIEY